MFYEDNYGGFSDIYSCNVGYIPDGPPGTKSAASQDIYLIYHEGEWKVIDVSPVETAEI